MKKSGIVMSNSQKLSLSKSTAYHDFFDTTSIRFPFLSPKIFRWFIICLLIGIIVGTSSALFLVLLEWVTAYRVAHSSLLYLLPFAGFLVGLLYYYFGQSAEGGNTILIENLHHKNQKIPFIMAPLVLLGTLVTHLFGGSAGREGTALQMASGLIFPFKKYFNLNDENQKTMVFCAIAAGFSSVFGTPLAGFVFALEFAKTGKPHYKSILPVLLSALFSHCITLLWGVHHTHYHIFDVPDVGLSSIFYGVIAAVLLGFCAFLFCFFLHYCIQITKKFFAFSPIRPLVGGFILIGLTICLGDQQFLGLGIPVIVSSFQQKLLISIFAIKLIFTIITLSTGFKGGEVTPLFFIGATLGSALSVYLPLPTSLLAGMGFVAVFAGATKTPIASFIMGLELFGVESAVFLAIACGGASLVSGSSSIYRK